MKLRDYQANAQTNTIKLWNSGVKSVLGVLPTGGGKTVVFSSIIRRSLPLRTLVIAHRQELIWQACEKIKETTGLSAEIEMGEYRVTMNRDLFQPKSSIIVSTVQTLTTGGDGGRLSKFNPLDFGRLIIDEAHHATSPMYRRVIDYFSTNPNLRVLGVTATPNRADKEALGQIFDEVAFDYELLDAIKDGWLVPIKQRFVSVSSLDYSAIRTTAGDLNSADLSAVMESEKNLYGIAHATIEISGDRRGIGFASSVSHARMMSEIFNRHNSGMAMFVHGGTDKEERRSIVTDFARGNIRWLWNCGVFTEGFDDSGVEVISMARPTKSATLYGQMCGRATRPLGALAYSLNETNHPALRRSMINRSAKPHCEIIDFVGNSGKHKLISVGDILGGKYSDEAIKAANEHARRVGKPVDMAQRIKEEEERLIEAKRRETERQMRRKKIIVRATYQTRDVDPFNLEDKKPVKLVKPTDNKMISEKMRDFLRRERYNPDKMTYDYALKLTQQIIARRKTDKLSVRQQDTLEKLGYSKSETSNMTKSEASATLDAVKANGWKKLKSPSRPVKKEPVAPEVINYDNQPIIDGDIPF